MFIEYNTVRYKKQPIEGQEKLSVVYSPEAYQRGIKSVNKKCLKLSTKESKQFEKLCKQDFACEADALKVLSRFESRLKMLSIHDAQVVALPRHKGKGRPAKGKKPDFYVYRIEGNSAILLQERIRLLERKSCFILATNQLDCEELSDTELLEVYKDQQKVERGFRFLKDPMFMASTLFLKSPKRIMALMMVMTLCLLVYAALEHRIRKALDINNETFPNQKGKPVSNPTARWVFQFFSGIYLLIIGNTQQVVLNLNEHHMRLLKLLGRRYEKLYSGNG
ncbi:MAG: IS1634 family transposase [Candidatus Electrothrix gigas]